MRISKWSLAALLALSACTQPGGVAPSAGAPAPSVIPIPASISLSRREFFLLDTATKVVIDAGALPAVDSVAAMLARLIGIPNQGKPRTPGMTGPRDYSPLRLGPGEPVPANSIHLSLAADRVALGAEGYDLAVTRDGVTLVAKEPAGLFYGMQTIRQLLPPSIELQAALNRVLWIPTGRISDTPRFAWRGAMLDVSRHFLGADDVKRFIDLMALYKLNRLHLHLADDQGWRIEIKSWPNLARFGGITEVGGGVGGYYTQEQFADLVAYAESRFIDIVPEIDMPAHINAALSAYPELNCDGVAPPPYTGIEVGFSAICVGRDTVYRFVDDLVREIGALVPSPWFHIGGDEVQLLSAEQYRGFIERVQGIVERNGKRMIGWGEIATTHLTPSSIVQSWVDDSARVHVARGGSVILSTSSRLYLDMKYDRGTATGLNWAGLISVRQVYDWDPATSRPGVPERAILGLEAPLWSETLTRLSDYEYLAFPRLIAVAEVGWSPERERNWKQFRQRLGAQAPRLQALGVNFYRAPDIPWGN